MNQGKVWLYRSMALALAMLLGTPLGALASAQETSGAQPPQSILPVQPPAADRPAVQEPPPGSAEIASLPDSPVPQTAPAPQQQQPAPPPPSQQQGAPSQPMGTAAAPAEPAGGIAATRPAGAAIAPGKQKRSHTLLIRWSLLIGAAVAIGTVVGLSSASPARP